MAEPDEQTGTEETGAPARREGLVKMVFTLWFPAAFAEALRVRAVRVFAKDRASSRLADRYIRRGMRQDDEVERSGGEVKEKNAGGK